MAASSSQSSFGPRLRLKICYLDQTRIFGISPDLTFSKLLTLVRIAFPQTYRAAKQRPSSLELTYLDEDGDTVIIDSDESLGLALLDVNRTESSLKVQVHVKLQKDDDRDTFNNERFSPHGRFQVVCSHFKAGFCKFGSSCRFSHARDCVENRGGFMSVRPALGNASQAAIRQWLANKQGKSGWDIIFDFTSADGFDDMKHILHRTKLSADSIHQFAILLTRQDIRTSQLRQATDKIYGALIGSTFLTRLRTHIQDNLKPTAVCIEPYLALSEELIGRNCNGCKEAPLDELKKLLDELETEDALTKKLRCAIARLLQQRQNMVNDQSDACSSSTDFRNLPIIPSTERLFCENAIHVPDQNNIGLMYRSVDAFLDTHFRLIQEDCTVTLSEGVQELRRNSRDPKLRVYTNVRLVDIECGGEAIVYRISFVDKRRDVDWEWELSGLMAGSLLCISHDRFQTFVWGLVTFRCPELLSEGLVDIQVLKESDQRLTTNREYTMAELYTDFEFYSNVLKKLQRPKMTDLPFQEHLVSLEPYVKRPIYVNPFRFMGGFSGWGKESIDEFFISQFCAQSTISFDASQTAALIHCLTKRLALVQGPPGTGKTFIGLLIVRILLKKFKARNNEFQYKKPILVVCHSNHALDQFFKGLCTQTKNFGGQFETKERLSKLAGGIVLLEDQTDTQFLAECLYEERNQAHSQKEILDEKIHQLVDRMTQKFVTIESLQGIAEEEQIQSVFYDGCNPHGVIQMWLNEEEKEAPQNQVNLQTDREMQNACNVFYHRNLNEIDFSKRVNVDLSKKYAYEGNIEVPEGNSILESPGNLVSRAANLEKEGVLDGSAGTDIPEKTGNSAILGSNGYLDKDDHYTKIGPTEADQGERRAEGLDKCMSSRKNPIPLERNKRMVAQESPYQEWIRARTKKSSVAKAERGEIFADHHRDLQEFKRPVEILVNDVDLWSLDKHARRKLHSFWLKRIRDDAQDKLAGLSFECEIACRRKWEIDDEIQISLLRRAKVVGMTTIAVACSHSLLEAFQAEIVVVLEAAAVSKSCFLTCLTHHLDVSLFEQLIRSGIEHEVLEVQGE